MPKKAIVAVQNPPPPLEEFSSDEELQAISVPKKQVQPKNLPELQAVAPPEVAPVKQRKKKNLSEEQKEVLRERLKVAHQRKAELAEARRKVKAEEEENHLAKKQLAILEQARLIKQRQKKEIEAIAKAAPPGDKPKKAPKIKYVVDDESSEEEEVVVVKKKRTPKAPAPEPIPEPVPQQSQSQFKFKFY
jgi:hypothetical protein